jgi:hypothetical protein
VERAAGAVPPLKIFEVSTAAGGFVGSVTLVGLYVEIDVSRIVGEEDTDGPDEGTPEEVVGTAPPSTSTGGRSTVPMGVGPNVVGASEVGLKPVGASEVGIEVDGASEVGLKVAGKAEVGIGEEVGSGGGQYTLSWTPCRGPGSDISCTVPREKKTCPVLFFMKHPFVLKLPMVPSSTTKSMPSSTLLPSHASSVRHTFSIFTEGGSVTSTKTVGIDDDAWGIGVGGVGSTSVATGPAVSSSVGDADGEVLDDGGGVVDSTGGGDANGGRDANGGTEESNGGDVANGGIDANGGMDAAGDEESSAAAAVGLLDSSGGEPSPQYTRSCTPASGSGEEISSSVPGEKYTTPFLEKHPFVGYSPE